MKKQVIIDKGNGLQQRLSYDDGTNKIIPETTYGPRQTDNALPVVGKKFIDETDLSVAYGEDCLFCKGKKNKSGVPFDTQCAILTQLRVSYSTCAGPLFQSVLFLLSGTDFVNGWKFYYTFYDKKGIPFQYFQIPVGLPFSFYLHKNSVSKMDIKIIDEKGKIGECFITIDTKGASVSNLYKNISKMKVIYDPNTHNFKYINTDKSNNLNYIDIVFGSPSDYSVNVKRLISGKTYKIQNNDVRDIKKYWTSEGNIPLTGFNGTLGRYNTLPILGYENVLAGFWTNLFVCDPGSLPDNPNDDNGVG